MLARILSKSGYEMVMADDGDHLTGEGARDLGQQVFRTEYRVGHRSRPRRMATKGQLATAPLQRVSDRSHIGDRTFAGASSGDGLAPIPAVGRSWNSRRESTQS